MYLSFCVHFSLTASQRQKMLIRGPFSLPQRDYFKAIYFKFLGFATKRKTINSMHWEIDVECQCDKGRGLTSHSVHAQASSEVLGLNNIFLQDFIKTIFSPKKYHLCYLWIFFPINFRDFRLFQIIFLALVLTENACF